VTTTVSETVNGVKWKARALITCAIGPLSIRQRIAVLVLALLLPMNALMVGAIVKFASLSRAAEYTHLRYTASVIASSVEAQLARYLAVARALAASPAILDDDLSAFRLQAAAAFPDISDAWLFVSNAESHVIMSVQPFASLRLRSPEGVAVQSRAFQTKSPVIGGVYRSSGTGKLFAAVEHPVFRDGKPFRSLTIAMSPEGFFRLLDAQHLPEGWIAGIADTQGRFVARSIANAAYAGQPVSKGWQATLRQTGMYKSVSLEGSKLVATNEVSPLSGWTIGVAVKESVLEAPVWTTLRWAISAGIAVSLLSLALAILVARRITRPILELERKASALVSGHPTGYAGGMPEVDRVWDALQIAVNERQRFERDLHFSEELLRTAAEGAQFGAHNYDAVTRRMSWSPELGRLLGLDYTARSGVTWETGASFIHPEDREKARAALHEIVKGSHRNFELEYRIVRKNGEVRWVMDRGRTFKDPQSGRTVRLTGIVIDITERKLGELRQQMLLKELDHRVKNTLAIVQSIAMQTLRSTKDPPQFASVFEARLMSLASAHSLLTQRAWEGADLGDIVRGAIAPFVSSAGESAFQLSGPTADIPANSTITLALMLHELLSNAAKYGSLSVPGGRVAISWRVTEAGEGRRVDLHWKEEGGPPAAEPARRGFGTRLLTMGAEQLGGQIALSFEESGLRCDLSFPLPASHGQPANGWTYSI
jgi:PAS domain S-box-containing protein